MALLTRRELVTVKQEVIIPKIEVREEQKEERDETLWRMFHPDSTPSDPINAEFDYDGYHVEIKNGIALIPQWLVTDFLGMGYTKGKQHGTENFGYTC
jgi:hypothetical protein